MILYLIASIIVIFFLSQITHELFHKLIASLWGAKTKIEIWFNGKIPSMRCSVISGNPGPLFLTAGIWNGIVLLVIGYILNNLGATIIAIGCYINSTIQIIYGIYEVLFLRTLPFKDYMRLHYYVYLLGLVLGIVFTSGLIREVI